MPQMGESIFEGTITKWLKKPGDAVQQDEPLFEISTDKVDAEIPSPAAGVLSEIKVQAGTTVQINTVVAVISAGWGSRSLLPSPAPQPAPAPAAATPSGDRGRDRGRDRGTGERVRSSPLVRSIAKENNLDLRKVPAPARRAGSPRKTFSAFWPRAARRGARSRPHRSRLRLRPFRHRRLPRPNPRLPRLRWPRLGMNWCPLTRMRSIIAQRMVESKRTSAHVHTVFKIDMSRIVRIREKEKSKYEQRNGVKLTYMPFHLPRGHRHPAQDAHRERFDGGRRHPLPQEHQSGHCRRPGLGADRARHPPGGGARASWASRGRSSTWRREPGPRSSSPKKSLLAPSRLPIPASSASSSERRSSISRSRRFSASAASLKNLPWLPMRTAPIRSPSAASSVSPWASITASSMAPTRAGSWPS